MRARTQWQKLEHVLLSPSRHWAATYNLRRGVRARTHGRPSEHGRPYLNRTQRARASCVGQHAVFSCEVAADAGVGANCMCAVAHIQFFAARAARTPPYNCTHAYARTPLYTPGLKWHD